MDSCMIDQLRNEERNLPIIIRDSQEVELYDYLLMKFTMKAFDSKQNGFQTNQKQFSQIVDHETHSKKRSTILKLFVRNDVQNKKGKSTCNQNEENEQQSFLKKLIQRYPSVFEQILSEEKITWEDILFNIIKRGSLVQIFSLCNNQSLEFDIQNYFSLKNPTINLYFESLFYNKTFKSQNLGVIKSIVTVDFNIFFKKPAQKTIEKVKAILFDRLENYFHELNQNQFESVMFYRNYQKFEQIYKVEETQKNQKIFELHYVQRLLQNSEAILQESKFYTFPVSQQFYVQNKNNLIHANFFNVKNSKQVEVNKNLLRSFMDAPYQTSLFVLYTLLESSEIKDTKKFFNNSKSIQYIDPIIWLFVKKELINALNIEAVSLSLWIMTDFWIKFVEGKAIQRVKLSKQSLLQAQKMSKLRDPRKIYAINQEAYSSVQTPMSGSAQKPLISSMEQFESTYKRPLMLTIIMWLLSLNVESTMLKYYCIENDLLKQMPQGDILPTLLAKNQYIFNSEATTKRFEHSKTLQEELKTKIMNAKSLEELKQLQQSYLKSEVNEKFSQSHDQYFSCFQQQPQQPLPWLQIIQSKQFLFPLLNKPSGYELILKLIEKNPRSYIKLYESYLFKIICSEIQKKNYEEMAQNKENRSGDVPYRFQGNKNAQPKKTISYSSQSMKQSSVKVQNLQKTKCEKQKKFNAIKSIVLLFKSHTKDENLKLTCNQLLKYL